MQLFVPYFGVVESVPCYESQHCDEQQFQTLSCVHYTIFSVVKLDLFIRALLLDRILVLEKLRVRLAYILLNIGLQLCKSKDCSYSVFVGFLASTDLAFLVD